MLRGKPSQVWLILDVPVCLFSFVQRWGAWMGTAPPSPFWGTASPPSAPRRARRAETGAGDTQCSPQQHLLQEQAPTACQELTLYCAGWNCHWLSFHVGFGPIPCFGWATGCRQSLEFSHREDLCSGGVPKPHCSHGSLLQTHGHFHWGLNSWHSSLPDWWSHCTLD